MKQQMNDNKHYLFSYGTLQLEKVQIENYGRLLKGKKDSLLGYRLDKLKITDPAVLKKSGKEFHPIAIKTGSPNDVIDGTIFEITEEELIATDKYEVNDYQRVLENFVSGEQAWIYIAKSEKPISTVSNNIKQIQNRISHSCSAVGRNRNEIRLLLATKTVDCDRIKEAFACGETLIAENKVQEVKQKFNCLQEFKHEQHFIGHLQTNKVKELLKYNITCIQSLDRLSLAKKLHNQLSIENRSIDVFIQVNTSNEESKFGIAPELALNFTKQVSRFNTLKIKGLMTIGLFSSDSVKVRECFKRLKSIQQEIIAAQIPNIEMKELSMGMSGDLEIAIEEGATIIRVGTAIFGKRQYPDSYYWNENQTID
jgi:pyridoxal phosphate enzyme (YggS family)